MRVLVEYTYPAFIPDLEPSVKQSMWVENSEEMILLMCLLSVYGVGSFRNVGEVKTNIWRKG